MNAFIVMCVSQHDDRMFPDTYNLCMDLFLVGLEVKQMFEYKVEHIRIRNNADALNAIAAEGWKLVSIERMTDAPFKFMVVFERKKDE